MISIHLLATVTLLSAVLFSVTLAGSLALAQVVFGDDLTILNGTVDDELGTITITAHEFLEASDNN